MNPRISLLALLTVILCALYHPAVGQDDYKKELETNFKNVLNRLYSLTGNTDPSILLSGNGQGAKGKYGTKLVLIPGASHTIDFGGSRVYEYLMEAPLDDSAKSRAYFDFFASLGKTHIEPQAFSIEYKVSDGQPGYTWTSRRTSGNNLYQYDFVIWAVTKSVAGRSYYSTNMRVTKKECSYSIREGAAVTDPVTVSYAALIRALSGNLGSRFKKLSRFSREADSTEFRPYLLLEDFTSGKTEKHTIYNNFWGYKGQLKYEAVKYFPDQERAAENFFEHAAAALNPLFNTVPVKTAYNDKKSLTYEWFSDSLPFRVRLSYYAEGLFPRQVSWTFVNSAEEVAALKLRNDQVLADKGDPKGLVDMGIACFSGTGVTKDLKKAMEYFEKAADKGSLPGMVNVGIMYYYGHGMRADEKKGLKWFKKAAAQGSSTGMYRMGVAYMDGRAVKKNTDVAMSWYKQAADSNYITAIIELGNMYKEGNGVESDAATAIAYYNKAVRLGSMDGLWQLGDLYQSKLQRMDSAVYYFTRAADGNYSWGMFSLGAIHYKEKEYQQALEWFNKGADLKNASCMFYKGLIYENGFGVAKNMITAKSWYRAAAQLGNERAIKKMKEIYNEENPVIQNYSEDWDDY